MAILPPCNYHDSLSHKMKIRGDAASASCSRHVAASTFCSRHMALNMSNPLGLSGLALAMLAIADSAYSAILGLN